MSSSEDSVFVEQMKRLVHDFRISNPEEYIQHIGQELKRMGVRVDKHNFEEIVTFLLQNCDRRPRLRDFTEAIRKANSYEWEVRKVEKDFDSLRNFIEFCRWSNRRRMESSKDEDGFPCGILSRKQFEEERSDFMNRCFKACEDLDLDVENLENFFFYCFSRGFDVEETMKRVQRIEDE